MKWKCTRCNEEYGVSIKKRCSEEEYICHICEEKERAEKKVKVFGKKTKRKAKKKALRSCNSNRA